MCTKNLAIAGAIPISDKGLVLTKTYKDLVLKPGWRTPLKNDGVRQLGWWHSQYMESHKIHVPNHHPETHGDLGIPHKAPYISAGSASELQTKALESLLSQGPWKGRGNLLDRRLSWTTVKCATHQHHAMERHHVNGNIMCYLRSPKNPTFLSEMWLPNCSVENTKHWSN